MTFQTFGLLLIAFALIIAGLIIAGHPIFIVPALIGVIGVGMCLVRDMTKVDKDDIE